VKSTLTVMLPGRDMVTVTATGIDGTSVALTTWLTQVGEEDAVTSAQAAL
jgi:hypothetical protein